jgi:hypothetical protein
MKINGLCNDEKITINIFLMLHTLFGKLWVFQDLLLKLKTFVALSKYWQVCDNVSCKCRTWTNWWLSWKIDQLIWRSDVFLFLKEWKNYLFLRTNLSLWRWAWRGAIIKTSKLFSSAWEFYLSWNVKSMCMIILGMKCKDWENKNIINFVLEL